MNDFFVYILKCKDGSFYTGHTDNLEYRISEHKLGKIPGYTSTRLPVELVFVQQCPTRDEALCAERQIKGWSRKKKIALINNNWPLILKLSNYKKRLNPSTSSGRTE